MTFAPRRAMLAGGQPEKRPNSFGFEMPSETFAPPGNPLDISPVPRAGARRPADAWPEVGPEGEPAPRFMLPDQGGQGWNVTDDEVAGKPMVVLFCRALNNAAVLDKVLGFRRLYDQFAALECNVVVITRQITAINAADRSEQGIPFRILADTLGDVTHRYEALAGGVADGLLTFVLAPSLHVTRVIRDPESLDPAAEALATVSTLLSAREAQPIGLHPPVLQIPGVLSAAECRFLVSLHDRADTPWNQPGDPEDQYDFKIRVGDHRRADRVDYVINDPEIAKHLDARLARRIRPQIRKAFQYTVSKRETYHLARYQGQRGGYSIGHRDNSSQDLAHRRFALSISLNAGEYQGGALRFREYGEQRYRLPMGAALVFSSSLLHEILAVTSGRRFVLLSHLFGEDAGQGTGQG